MYTVNYYRYLIFEYHRVPVLYANMYKLENFRQFGPRRPGRAYDPNRKYRAAAVLTPVRAKKIRPRKKKRYPDTSVLLYAPQQPSSSRPRANTAVSSSRHGQMHQPSVLVAGSRDPAGSRGSCMVHACMRIGIPGIPGSRARARRVNHAYYPEWSLTLKVSNAHTSSPV
eukprot:SAG11_NODE_1118_length_5794_cov_8.276032_3_plen_169_part_00